MVTGRANSKFKHGLRAGWTEYRYGPQRVTKTVPIFRGEKKEHAINVAMDLMRDWRQTPFEHQGTTKAGMRSALCQAGFGWLRSDSAANEIVLAALVRLGAEYPTHEEGQRQYTIERENCKWCGCPLPECDQKYGFCSTEHARAAISHWDFVVRDNADRIYMLAQYAADRLSRTKKCANPTCPNTFHPSAAHGKYCSRSCSSRQERSSRSLICIVDGTEFQAASPKAKFCSKRCEHIHHGWRPKALIPQIFDYLFSRAA